MNKKLFNILDIAYNYVPYYNHILNQVLSNKKLDSIEELSFEDIPIHDKNDIKKWGWENFISINTKLYDYIINKTTGTTGEPMDIIWKKFDYITSLANHWYYRYKRFNVTPEDKCLKTERYIGMGSYSVVRNGNELIFNTDAISLESLKHITNQILEFKPSWIYCEASVLYIILKYSISRNINILDTIKGIEFKSEPILKYYADYFNTHLKSIPTINMYGCTETNGISYTCEMGIQHIMSKNTYVETLNEDNSKSLNFGNICVTSLHNTIMPFIRYKLDDFGRIKRQYKCSCGRVTDILELSCTRIPEFLVLDDIEYYNKGIVFYPLERFNEYEKQDGDIIFRMFRISLSKYVVSVEKDGDINAFKEIFVNIMSKYGVNKDWFEIVQLSPKKSGISGVLRINC